MEPIISIPFTMVRFAAVYMPHILEQPVISPGGHNIIPPSTNGNSRTPHLTFYLNRFACLHFLD